MIAHVRSRLCDAEIPFEIVHAHVCCRRKELVVPVSMWGACERLCHEFVSWGLCVAQTCPFQREIVVAGPRVLGVSLSVLMPHARMHVCVCVHVTL